MYRTKNPKSTKKKGVAGCKIGKETRDEGNEESKVKVESRDEKHRDIY